MSVLQQPPQNISVPGRLLGFAPIAARSSTPCPLALEALWHTEAAFLAAMWFLRNNPTISFLKPSAGGSSSGGGTAGFLLSILQHVESRKVLKSS